MGKTLFVGLHRDKVVALDTETGAEKWVFYTDGPVRFAPVAWKDRLFVACDDGYLYCLDAAKGALLWKFRGVPSDRTVLGNTRLISTWPVRGAPVVAEDKVYFAAGIWSFMGVYIHALDAKTGEVVWTNNSSSNLYGRESFIGPSPQGYLVALEDKLIVPCGRGVPARFWRKTGKLRNFGMRFDHSRSGTCRVTGIGSLLFYGSTLVSLTEGVGSTMAYSKKEDGKLHFLRGYPHDPVDIYRHRRVLTPEAVYTSCKDYFALNRESWDKITGGAMKLVSLPDLADDVWIKAGKRLYASKGDTALAIDLPGKKVTWQAKVEGGIGGMIAADGKLFVSTWGGRIYCFGKTDGDKQWKLEKPVPPAKNKAFAEAARILKATGVTEGYCLMLGLNDEHLVEALLRQSKLQVIGVDPDAAKVNAIRRKLDRAGLYGQRVALRTGDPVTFSFPPYIASLVVSGDSASAKLGKQAFLTNMYQSLRPYGGIACFDPPPAQRASLIKQIKGSKLPQAEVKTAGDYVLLTRAGALPDAADVTHETVDAANTYLSRDKRVKLPLGVLWFGGPADGDKNFFLYRTQSSRPQVAGGRMIAEGLNMIHATDIYTGRLLWQKKLPDARPPGNIIGKAPVPEIVIEGEKVPPHKPGYQMVSILGTSFVSLADGIYVCRGKTCLRLDPDTGKTVSEFTLPDEADGGFLSIWKDLLIVGTGPVKIGSDQYKLMWNDAVSRKLVVMNRHSGKIVWTRDAAYGFRHTTITIGGGKLFCIDRLPEGVLKASGVKIPASGAKPKILALDIQTGKEVWSTDKDAVGIWMSYSAEHDILVQGPDHGKNKLIAYRGKDGRELWRQQVGLFSSMAILYHDRIILHRGALDLRTGDRLNWHYQRSYGCNTPSASENFLFFRSHTAGFYDLQNQSGTGNFSPFRSSCANSLVAAGGVLSAPNMAGGCVCDHPILTSLALVHDPSVDIWTWAGMRKEGQGVGINFGAPGDRVTDHNTFWLTYPRNEAYHDRNRHSHNIQVKIEPKSNIWYREGNPEWFRVHSTSIKGGNLKWVAASGAIGMQSVALALDPKAEKENTYTVRLCFMEPEEKKPGERVFSVSIQGREVLKDFDVAREAGGPLRSVVKEFRGMKVKDVLTMTLTASKEATVISGIEVVAQEEK